MPAFFHCHPKARCCIARVHKADTASWHGAYLASHEVENDFSGSETIGARTGQQARSHDHEAQPFAVETLERRHLLVSLARVVGPARDDVEWNGIGFVGNRLTLFSDCDRPARGSENDRLHTRSFSGVAEQARAFDVNVVHRAGVFTFTRDFTREVIDLADAFNRALVIVGVGDGTGESFHTEIDEPVRNGRGHHANIFRAGFRELANEMRAEETWAAGDERDGALALLDSGAPLGAGRGHARGAFS